VESTQAFAGGRTYDDDFTVMVVQRTAGASPPHVHT